MHESPPVLASENERSSAFAVVSGSGLRCKCCAVGFPLEDGWHIPTQRLGMIPPTKCTLIRKGDVQRYRDHLNAQDDGRKWRNFRRGQRVRKYGDYLYAQDREKFMVELREWLNDQNK
jgi:hypothetical protein